MITRFFKKYLSIVFVLALFVGSFHHHSHDDLSHEDCQICTIASNLLIADTPKDVKYLSDITLISESVISKLINLHLNTQANLLHARAPPLFS